MKILPHGNLHIKLAHLTSELYVFLAWVSEKLKENIEQKSKEMQTLEINKVNLYSKDNVCKLQPFGVLC